MTSHSSAIAPEETPHPTETSRTTINRSLKRRAQSLLKDRTVDTQTRTLIRYALEINDPYLAQIVRRVDAGETTIERIDLSETAETSEDDSSEKIDALAEIICRAGDEAAKAFLVLMATIEGSTQPKVLANAAKHGAFNHCGELNLNSKRVRCTISAGQTHEQEVQIVESRRKANNLGEDLSINLWIRTGFAV